MVVFLAVDPRIIVSAIDKKLEDVPDEVNLLSPHEAVGGMLLSGDIHAVLWASLLASMQTRFFPLPGIPQVNGLVYLEKIIHIPFCLPQISKEDQRKYLQGLLGEEPPPAPSSSLPNRPEGAASASGSPTPAAPTTAARTTAAPTTAAPVTGPEPSSTSISTVSSTGTGASWPTPEVRETRETRRALTAAERTVFTAVLENIKATPRKIKRVSMRGLRCVSGMRRRNSVVETFSDSSKFRNLFSSSWFGALSLPPSFRVQIRSSAIAGETKWTG